MNSGENNGPGLRDPWAEPIAANSLAKSKRGVAEKPAPSAPMTRAPALERGGNA